MLHLLAPTEDNMIVPTGTVILLERAPLLAEIMFLAEMITRPVDTGTRIAIVVLQILGAMRLLAQTDQVLCGGDNDTHPDTDGGDMPLAAHNARLTSFTYQDSYYRERGCRWRMLSKRKWLMRREMNILNIFPSFKEKFVCLAYWSFLGRAGLIFGFLVFLWLASEFWR